MTRRWVILFNIALACLGLLSVLWSLDLADTHPYSPDRFLVSLLTLFGCVIVGFALGRPEAIVFGFSPVLLSPIFGQANAQLDGDPVPLPIFELILSPVYILGVALAARLRWVRRQRRDQYS